MFVSRVLQSASALPRALAALIPEAASETLANKPRNLYSTLSRLPEDGIGARVFQTRWQSKGIEGCFWEVSRVRLKCEGTHGKAWGKLVWRGKLVSEKEERIRGGLKYKWNIGHSTGKNLPLVQPISPLPVSKQVVMKTSKVLPSKTTKERRPRSQEEVKAQTPMHISNKATQDAPKVAMS
ncbi:hypothetical protein EW145_g763 [Phellinidium pouzarii]|uniref:Uncharacterized protein n=1 Tax=Phellinidium pouzarii TaxID=167371 RepID=A0A4S4LH35_9AGAM|nr:hypothetical protein EW145_g763 [Phellinidium pouzarii]